MVYDIFVKPSVEVCSQVWKLHLSQRQPETFSPFQHHNCIQSTYVADYWMMPFVGLSLEHRDPNLQFTDSRVKLLHSLVVRVTRISLVHRQQMTQHGSLARPTDEYGHSAAAWPTIQGKGLPSR